MRCYCSTYLIKSRFLNRDTRKERATKKFLMDSHSMIYILSILRAIYYEDCQIHLHISRKEVWIDILRSAIDFLSTVDMNSQNNNDKLVFVLQDRDQSFDITRSSMVFSVGRSSMRHHQVLNGQSTSSSGLRRQQSSGTITTFRTPETTASRHSPHQNMVQQYISNRLVNSVHSYQVTTPIFSHHVPQSFDISMIDGGYLSMISRSENHGPMVSMINHWKERNFKLDYTSSDVYENFEYILPSSSTQCLELASKVVNKIVQKKKEIARDTAYLALVISEYDKMIRSQVNDLLRQENISLTDAWKESICLAILCNKFSVRYSVPRNHLNAIPGESMDFFHAVGNNININQPILGTSSWSASSMKLKLRQGLKVSRFVSTIGNPRVWGCPQIDWVAVVGSSKYSSEHDHHKFYCLLDSDDYLVPEIGNDE